MKRKHIVTDVIDFTKLKEQEVFELDSTSEDSYYGENLRVFFKEVRSNEVVPGVFRITQNDMGMTVAEDFRIAKEKNVDYLSTVNLTDKTKLFFEKSPEIMALGLLARRGILLHGKPGCGKTHQLNQAAMDLTDANTVIYFTSLDEITPQGLINFLARRKISDDVKKLIICIEDLGGAEVDPESVNKIASSSLLSFLDGTQGAWKDVPTVIYSTTNYPQNFLANLIDRPGRFDEVIEVLPPPTTSLGRYMSELLKRPLTDDEMISLWNGMSLAHAKEAVIRHLIYGEALSEYLTKIKAHSEKAKNNFEERFKMGL